MNESFRRQTLAKAALKNRQTGKPNAFMTDGGMELLQANYRAFIPPASQSASPSSAMGQGKAASGNSAIPAKGQVKATAGQLRALKKFKSGEPLTNSENKMLTALRLKVKQLGL